MANQFQNTGSFVPTTNIWDVQQLYSIDVKSPEFKELLVRLYQNVNNIAVVLNTKTSGYHPLNEFLNGNLYFPNPNISSTSPTNATYRQEFTTTVNFGELPNAGTKSVPHGIMIDESYIFTHIGGAANRIIPTYLAIPIGYTTVTPGNEIEITVDSINVNITTAIDYSAYTNCILELTYLKN